MPTTRITLALNTNQSQKAPLLVSSSTPLDPTSNDSCRTLVIKAAQSKLRLKKASRVFVAGTGKELINEEDWRRALKDDVLLLVSAGEEYIGLTKEEAKASDDDPPDIASLRLGNPDCSIVNLANRALIDPLSITQLETTAQTLPGIIHAVAQPDLHPGTKFPIGAVFVSDGWIHPPLIGGDIGCGMAWYKTRLTPSHVECEKGRKLAEKLRGVEGPWRTQQNRLTWLTDSSKSDSPTIHSAGEEWDTSLGTIGAGNHFAEIQVVEEVLDGNWKSNSTLEPRQILKEGEVVLLVHSGSRGFGGDILKRYTSNDRTSMRSSEPAASAYLEEHDRACAWAARNRDLIALRFLACIEPGQESWDLGINDSDSSATVEDIQTAARAVQSRKVVDICHNNVEATSWPPSPPSPVATTDTPQSPSPPATRVFIHRKGAAPTHDLVQSSLSTPSQPQLLPILPLPGSRGTPTLILHPLHPPKTAHGLHNALSLAHGAGRALSRAKAFASLPAKYNHKPDDLLRGDFVKINAKGNKSVAGAGGWKGEEVRGGVWVVCEEKALVWEEAVEAYKDVWDVGDDLVQAGVAERVGWCRGRVSYKVRKS